MPSQPALRAPGLLRVRFGLDDHAIARDFRRHDHVRVLRDLVALGALGFGLLLKGICFLQRFRLCDAFGRARGAFERIAIAEESKPDAAVSQPASTDIHKKIATMWT